MNTNEPQNIAVTDKNCMSKMTINSCNEFCGKCGKEIRPGETIYQHWESGFNRLGGYFRRIINCCKDCGLPDDRRFYFVRCDSCNRLIYKVRSGRRHNHIFCSHACQYNYYNTKLSQEKRAARVRECPQCGAVFSGQRSDVKYCSNACKQKHYRNEKY